jgi:hypothetical protein
MLARSACAISVTALLLGSVARAEDPASTGTNADSHPTAQPTANPSPSNKVDHWVIEPSPLVLRTADDRAQLLVTAVFADGATRDVTQLVTYHPMNSAIVSVEEGKARPLGDGETRIRIVASLAADGGLQMAGLPGAVAPPTDVKSAANPHPAGAEVVAEVEARVEQFAVSRRLNFTNDIIPVLTKFGCNSGGCHGKFGGQNGFALSLLGFDPQGDYDAIVKQAHGRRVFPLAPERSLMLTKPTGEAVHGGGRRFSMDSETAELLRRWIEQGLPFGKAEDPRVVRIEAFPRERVLPRNSRQQLRVVATYSDDSAEDVTAEAQYQAQQPDLLTVSSGGLAGTLDSTGEGAIMIRYMGQVDVARLTVPYGEPLPESAYANFHPRGAIDELVMAKWQKLGVAPSPRSSDVEFLRRASIDLIGTLPTPEEVREFVADANPQKRDALVDRLLERDEYASYWANIWGDVLRNKRRNGDQAKRGTFAFAAWIREAFAQNMPYDQFAAAILTAQGNVADSPAVVWYREVRNQIHQVNDTAQLFMGTRINCANCHHHPYERWSQDDYWGMAAFFARLGNKQGEVSGENAIFVRKDGGVSQPRSGRPMKPKALGGPEYEYVRGQDPRQLLADWLAQPDNPYFAPAIANRLWAHFMGVGLVEAVDDMRITNPPSNPALLDNLAQQFVADKFDLKRLVRRIMTSEVYGLSSLPIEENAKDRRNYARYVTRRMPAEVLSDAIDRVTGSPEKYSGLPRGTRAIDLPDEGVTNYLLTVFGRSQRETPCECERSAEPNLSQVLHLMNSEEIQSKLNTKDGRLAELVASHKPPEALVDELYLVSFSRLPDDAERSDAASYLASAKDLRAALSDLTWALLNSKEFLYNH